MELLKVVIVTLILFSQTITGSTVGTVEESLPTSSAKPIATTLHVEHRHESSTQPVVIPTTDAAPTETTTAAGGNVTQGQPRLSEGQDPNDDPLLVKVSSKEDAQDQVVSKDGNVLIRVGDTVEERNIGDDTPDVIGDVKVYGQRVYEGSVCHEDVPLSQDSEEGELEVSGAPVMGNCTAKAWSWTVDMGEGYRADITLHSLTINHKAGEFLIIGAGSSMDDLWEDQKNPVFTAAVNTPKQLRVLTTTGLFSVMLVTNTPTGFKGSFKLSYKRFGDQVTTPESTTPTSTLPPAVENAQTEIVVYLGGLTPVQFGKKEDEFKTAVASMAKKYCDQKGITLVETPNSGNVVLSLITQCDINWPYSEECVHTNMSVTVITPESSNPEDYELTVTHLQEMWDTLAPPDGGLKNMGLYVYEIPDPDSALYIWLGVSLGILLVFLAFLIFIYRFNIFQEYSRMRDRTSSASSHKSSVTSNDSWFSTTHQQIPPFLHSDTAYIEYEPTPMPAPAPAPLPNYGPPPSYGPPQGYGGAIRFFANIQTNSDFDNLAFEEEEEYTADQTPRSTQTEEKTSASADC